MVMTELRDYHTDYCGAVARALAETGALIEPLTAVALARGRANSLVTGPAGRRHG